MRPPVPPFTEETARQKVQAAALRKDMWAFDAEGYMRRREASINDVPIDEADRRIFGPRPEAERGETFPLR